MSAGDFQYSSYETDSGAIHRIRIQPETLALSVGGATNNPPAGAVTGQGTVKVSKTRREFGIGARSVTIAWDGATPAGYSGDNITRIPVLTPATYNSITVGASGSYLGVDVVIVSKTAESVV